MKVYYILTGIGEQFLQVVCQSFCLNIIDGIMIVAILIICFEKTLTKSRKVVHNFQTKKTVRAEVILLRPMILKMRSYFYQSTSSTLTYKLDLDLYSNIENIRSKNPYRLIMAHVNINSLRNKFDSQRLKLILHFLLLSLKQKATLCIESIEIQMEKVFFPSQKRHTFHTAEY